MQPEINTIVTVGSGIHAGDPFRLLQIKQIDLRSPFVIEHVQTKERFHTKEVMTQSEFIARSWQ